MAPENYTKLTAQWPSVKCHWGTLGMLTARCPQPPSGWCDRVSVYSRDHEACGALDKAVSGPLCRIQTRG